MRIVDIRHFASTKENSDDCGEPVPPTASATAKTASTIVDLSKNLHSVDAEIRWCLHMVTCHSSYNSCADLGAMFQVMFPDSEIASQFTQGKTKATNTMLYGIAPEFKKKLIYDINASPFYTVSFDESFNSQMQMSQMDVGVRYWNNRKHIAETRYFDSKFMRRPTADVLLKNLDESILSLNRGQFLQLAMDGPHINGNVLKLLDDKLVSENLSKTVNMGSCAQHVVHGVLKTGTKSSEFDTDKILKSMFWLFESPPVLRDAYLKEGISGKFPLR